MMKSKIKQNNIDKIECTHFEKIKVCAFIFAVFKKAIDCIIIERPLNDKIPEAKMIAEFSLEIDKIFEPRVTSKMP